MLVLEDLQRRLGVALGRSVVQRLAGAVFAVGAALQFSHLDQRVKLGDAPILRRGQTDLDGEGVTLQAVPGRFVNHLQPRLSRLNTLGRERYGVKAHVHQNS